MKKSLIKIITISLIFTLIIPFQVYGQNAETFNDNNFTIGDFITSDTPNINPNITVWLSVLNDTSTTFTSINSNRFQISTNNALSISQENITAFNNGNSATEINSFVIRILDTDFTRVPVVIPRYFIPFSISVGQNPDANLVNVIFDGILLSNNNGLIYSRLSSFTNLSLPQTQRTLALVGQIGGSEPTTPTTPTTPTPTTPLPTRQTPDADDFTFWDEIVNENLVERELCINVALDTGETGFFCERDKTNQQFILFLIFLAYFHLIYILNKVNRKL